MTEWNLLKESEDIQPKDAIVVESMESGKTLVLRYVKEESYAVLLRDKDGVTYSFDKDTLEDNSGEYLIVGKHDE